MKDSRENNAFVKKLASFLNRLSSLEELVRNFKEQAEKNFPGVPFSEIEIYRDGRIFKLRRKKTIGRSL